MIGKLNEISDKSCSLLETDFSLLEEITFSSCDKFNKFESFSKTYKSASLSKSNSKPSIIKSKKAFDVSRFIKFFKLYFNVADFITTRTSSSEESFNKILLILTPVKTEGEIFP